MSVSNVEAMARAAMALLAPHLERAGIRCDLPLLGYSVRIHSPAGAWVVLTGLQGVAADRCLDGEWLAGGRPDLNILLWLSKDGETELEIASVDDEWESRVSKLEVRGVHFMGEWPPA